VWRWFNMARLRPLDGNRSQRRRAAFAGSSNVPGPLGRSPYGARIDLRGHAQPLFAGYNAPGPADLLVGFGEGQRLPAVAVSWPGSGTIGAILTPAARAFVFSR